MECEHDDHDGPNIISSNCNPRLGDECDGDSWIWESFIGEVISPGDADFPKLKTIDVAPLLQVKAVYISGGLDKIGSPLIIFPPSSHFDNINDADIEKIFHYLIQRFRPEARKNGFTAIIDRRSDKWSSVKFVLTRLQNFFTATVQSAYVLKPQGFFQKYSESNFKSHLGDYKFKVGILNDVVNLYEHVDKAQLTSCFGGTLDYAHDEWVQHRTAIDRFGETCRSIASRLVTLKQIFDKTDLSNSDTVETQHVLDVHGQMWFDVRDDISNAQLTGNTQLKCIEDDFKVTEHSSPLQLLQSSIHDLQFLVENLALVKDKFERIWEKHQTHVLQSIQFSFFEREFNEVNNQFSTLHDKLSSMTELGDSETAAKKLKHDAEQFQLETEEPLAKLVDLQERGDGMIKNDHYCSNSIQEKCREMESLKEELDGKINERKSNLGKSAEVHQCLDQVNAWCQTGVDILASQPLDRFQSAEGAEKALKEIDEFLKKPQGVNLGKINRMEKTGKELKDEHLLEQVRKALKRISEVTEMMSNREASFKKLVAKRPVQPVAPVSPQSPSVENQRKKKDGISPLGGLHLKKNNKNSKTPSPNSARRPISIIITPESGNQRLSISSPSLPAGDRPKSPSTSPRNSNNIDIEDDSAVLKRRTQVMNELIETERVYVYDLQCVVDGYMKEYQDGSPNLPRELSGKKSVIFGNIDEIYLFHRDVFLRELEVCMDQPLLIGEVFIAKEDEFQMYASYCKNKPSSEALRKECADVPFFQKCQRQLGHQLPLHAYLLKPIQRITKYQLILKKMIKYSQKSTDCCESLQAALEGMMKVLKNLNDVMHSTYIRGFMGNLGDQGKLLMQDSFIVWQTSKKTRINVNISQFKGRPRQVFLYEKLAVLTKREDEAHKDCVYYQCKNVLKMIDIGLTETAKGDPLKFGLWMQNKSEFYTLQAPSQDIKNCWVHEIRKLLQSQFSQVKESRKLSDLSLERRKSEEPVVTIPGFENNNPTKYDEVIRNVFEEEDDDADDDNWSDESDWSDDEEEETTTSAEEESKVMYSAIADYSAFESSELSFIQGDLVQVLRIGDGGWWFARLQRTAEEGWVPGSYLEIHHQDHQDMI